MTKRELILKLTNIPDTADICLVGPDHKINDLDHVAHMTPRPGLLHNDEVYFYPTKGRA